MTDEPGSVEHCVLCGENAWRPSTYDALAEEPDFIPCKRPKGHEGECCGGSVKAMTSPPVEQPIKLMPYSAIRLTLLCEICGVESPSKPWPSGWCRTGRSRLRAASDRATPVVGACFCPEHSDHTDTWVNPPEREVRRLVKEIIMTEILECHREAAKEIVHGAYVLNRRPVIGNIMELEIWIVCPSLLSNLRSHFNVDGPFFVQPCPPFFQALYLLASLGHVTSPPSLLELREPAPSPIPAPASLRSLRFPSAPSTGLQAAPA